MRVTRDGLRPGTPWHTKGISARLFTFHASHPSLRGAAGRGAQTPVEGARALRNGAWRNPDVHNCKTGATVCHPPQLIGVDTGLRAGVRETRSVVGQATAVRLYTRSVLSVAIRL